MASIEAPPELYELFVADAEEAREFLNNIREYNSIFLFTSFSAKIDKELASSRKGVNTFKAHGQIYHSIRVKSSS